MVAFAVTCNAKVVDMLNQLQGDIASLETASLERRGVGPCARIKSDYECMDFVDVDCVEADYAPEYKYHPGTTCVDQGFTTKCGGLKYNMVFHYKAIDDPKIPKAIRNDCEQEGGYAALEKSNIFVPTDAVDQCARVKNGKECMDLEKASCKSVPWAPEYVHTPGPCILCCFEACSLVCFGLRFFLSIDTCIFR